MIRKIVTAVILVPLAIIIIAFAVANRQTVTVAFDPFDTAQPAYAAALPLFVLIFVLVIFGVVLGGLATWLRQARWQWAARRAESENRQLRLELDRLKRDLSATPPARLFPPYQPAARPPLRSPTD
jgi:uncharacterized integral membrane protein